MINNKTIPAPIVGFNAVEAMREAREKLSEKYWQHTDVLKKDMLEVRKKYNFKPSKTN
ncbi:MAG: hypothetical protein QM541_03205 [Flavobacterium sp.]|nr:hypothetical protein [Flavobacterium sp.]